MRHGATQAKGGRRVRKTGRTCHPKRVRADTSPGPVHHALPRECPSAVCTQFEAAARQRASTRTAGTGRCRWAVHSRAGASWEPFRAGTYVRTLGGRTRDPAQNAWIRPSTSHKQTTLVSGSWRWFSAGATDCDRDEGQSAAHSCRIETAKTLKRLFIGGGGGGTVGCTGDWPQVGH